MNKFIVLSTQRTGSSYVCSLLDNHPRIRCLQEIFLPKRRSDGTYRSWRRVSLGRRIGHLLNRRESIDSYLAELCGGSQGVDAFGYKLMYAHLRRYPELLDWCRGNGVSIVHLIRRNALKMIVSRRVARKRGFYHSRELVEDVTVKLNTARLISDLRQVEDLVDHHRSLFSSLPYSLPYMEATYEDFLLDRDGEVRRILAFLECDADVALSSELVKTSSDSLESLIENYGEVCRALRGSPFEKYLEGERRTGE